MVSLVSEMQKNMSIFRIGSVIIFFLGACTAQNTAACEIVTNTRSLTGLTKSLDAYLGIVDEGTPLIEARADFHHAYSVKYLDCGENYVLKADLNSDQGPETFVSGYDLIIKVSKDDFTPVSVEFGGVVHALNENAK